MMGSWKVGAQLSTSHTSPDSLDPLWMLETVRFVQQTIDLDLLILGFREAPATFREFCGLVDAVNGVLQRLAKSEVEKRKSQPTVKLSPRLSFTCGVGKRLDAVVSGQILGASRLC
jgi:hypothetical protein